MSTQIQTRQTAERPDAELGRPAPGMLPSERIAEIAKQHELSPVAYSWLKQFNTSAPVKLVGGTLNVTGLFQSPIMGVSLQHASQVPELAHLYMAHYIRPVKFIVCQPCKILLHFVDHSGRNRGFSYTPDFFQVSDDGPELVECKTEEELLELSDPRFPKAQPWRYVKGQDGKWRCPSAEVAAARMGLKFRVFSSAEIPVTLLNNIIHFADYFDESKPTEVDTRILEWVRANPGTEFRHVVEAMGLTGNDTDRLNFMIVNRDVYVDLANEPLAPNYTAKIYPNETAAQIHQLELATTQKGVVPEGKIISFKVGDYVRLKGGHATIVEIGAQRVTVVGEGGTTTHRMAELLEIFEAGDVCDPKKSDAGAFYRPLVTLPPEDQKRVLERFESIKPFLMASGDPGRPKKTRSQRRYLKNFLAAKQATGCGLNGLVDRKNHGNQTRRLSPRVLEIISSAITEVYLCPAAPSVEFTWGEICRRCEANDPPLQPPSRQTILAIVSKLEVQATKRAREGHKSAYQASSPMWQDEWDGLSIDGEFQWASGHIDHTQWDLDTPPTADGFSHGRPWGTVMVLPRYRRPVALVLSYEPPSYRSCMLVIRDCVRRHGRLPKVITVDGGAEFRSHYFETLLARFGVNKKVRPPVKPRFGSVLERMNLTITSQLLHNMPGNTKVTKLVRMVDKSNTPANFAMLPLDALYDCMSDYLFGYLDNRPDALTGESPRQRFDKDEPLGGLREFKKIVYDRNFLILTLPTTPSGKAKVFRSGIRLHHLTYWAAELRNPALLQKSLPVRYDPEDFSKIYLLIDGNWVECTCRQMQKRFLGLTEKEFKFLSLELLAGSKLAEKRRMFSATSIAGFFYARGLTPTVQKLRSQAAENRAARTIKTVTPIMGDEQTDGELLEPADMPGLPAPTNTGEQASRRKPKNYTIAFKSGIRQ